MKFILSILFSVICQLQVEVAAGKPLNVLLITADDLGYEAMEFLGGEVSNVTPNLSRLAQESLSFKHGHVNIAICAPSRSVIATGRYGHNSGCFGFNKLPKPIPTLFGTFQKNGYLTGILGKVSHSTCDLNFRWDFEHDYGDLGSGRSPKKYHDYATEFFEKSKTEGKPFYFMVNSHDPHRPFHDPLGGARKMRGAEEPSRLFSPEEIAVPTYLPDLPEVRTELSHYYNSIRRLDDTVGKVLEALDASGQADHTLVVFITDNGSAFPFAKANTYVASSQTPMLMRWPGVTKPGAVDDSHFVSEVDFFATFVDAAELKVPEGLDGQSLVPLLKGEPLKGREYVFTQVDYTIGGPPKPMRCIQDKEFAYIFNAFSDGKFAYRNNNEGLTFEAMEAAGKTDPLIQERVDMFRHRVVQEFYDLKSDPGCTVNLIDSSDHRELVSKYQIRLREWMVDTKDHCIDAFDVREDPAKLAEAVKNYPKMVRPEEKKVEKDEKPSGSSDDDRSARRKAKRAAKKAAEEAGAQK